MLKTQKTKGKWWPALMVNCVYDYSNTLGVKKTITRRK
jgi:hypothetical protein